jgi:hypothetical protein
MGILRRKPSFNLRVLIYQEEDIWIAHCLELDIMTANPKQSIVEKDIFDLIIAQIESAFEHGNLKNIFKPAPPEDWEKLYYASKRCNLKKFKKPDESPFHGVELCFA